MFEEVDWYVVSTEIYYNIHVMYVDMRARTDEHALAAWRQTRVSFH